LKNNFQQKSTAEAGIHYAFQAPNPFLKDPEAFQKGIKFFKQGNIPDAILAFEAAVQADPNNSKGWLMLGQAQAENDR